MFKELTKDLNSIKKIQPETKDTLIEKRTICRETTMERMKLRIKSMIWNIKKQKITNENKEEEKRIHKK